MRLCLNLFIEDLAYRFNISKSTVSRIFQKWIDVMAIRLQFLITWHSKNIVHTNMPQIFKNLYPNVSCIIDCSEIFMERLLSFQARAQTYSNYKKHNTVKFLIAVSPTGTICFISQCWGGCVSDKFLTQKSGILHLLDPGDMMIADRGFNIAEGIQVLFGANLEIPAFTKGKSQLSPREVEKS